MSNSRPRQKPSILKNVTPFVIPNPVGVDSPIKDLQLHLSDSIAWLKKSFNRADIMSRKENGDDIVFPKGWVNENVDEMPMIALDYWEAYSFFTSNSEESIDDWNEFDDNIYERDVSLYFWFNLFDISKNHAEYSGKTYPFENELKAEILKSLDSIVWTGSNGLELLKIENDPLKVYEEFTFDVTEKQFHYPYKILRIDLKLTYDYENCI